MSKIETLGTIQVPASALPEAVAVTVTVAVTEIPSSTRPSTAPVVEKQSLIQKFFGEQKQADTKTFFDSLRNMGICIAMLLGLPTLYAATDYLPHALQTVAGCFVIGATLALATANLAWTLQALKEKSSLIAKGFLVGVGSSVILAFVVNAFFLLPGLK